MERSTRHLSRLQFWTTLVSSIPPINFRPLLLYYISDCREDRAMGDDNGGGSGSVGIIAILVIFIVVVAALFLMYRGGVFGGKKTEVDINVTTPSK